MRGFPGVFSWRVAKLIFGASDINSASFPGAWQFGGRSFYFGTCCTELIPKTQNHVMIHCL